MEKDFAGLLHKNQLKITGPRLGVLQVIAQSDAAITQPALEKIMGADVDRVTLYRILKTFEEKGILHKVIDLNGTANYAICSPRCTVHEHHDEHFHFNCINCKKVYCLDDVPLQSIKIPEGFTAKDINLVISGLCDKCNAEQQPKIPEHQTAGV